MFYPLNLFFKFESYYRGEKIIDYKDVHYTTVFERAE